MKKVFLLLIAGLMATLSHAEVYYLLPATGANAPVGNVYDVLPWEGDGTGENREVSPERRAFEYCRDGINGGTAKYLTIKDVAEGKLLVDGKPAMTTLWVNIDRWGLSLGDFDAMFNDAVTAGLSAYVKAGGNLFLSKQAARLASKIGRAQWWPNDYQTNGYFNASDEWQMCVHFCTDSNIDNPFHACMKYMENGQSQDGLDFVTRFPLVSGEGAYRRSDNNCAWGDWANYLGTYFNEDEQKDLPLYGGCDPLRRSTFENGMNCKVLGGWGHTRGLDYAGFIEFYPQGDYKGTVMAMGLAAYQWGAQNKSEYNVKKLTKGILEYLSDEHPFDYVWATEPDNAEVGVDQTISVEHKDNSTVYWWTNKPDVVSFSAETGENVTVSFAKVAKDVVIKALRKGDGIQHRRNVEYPVEKTIFVNPNLHWTHIPDVACVGEEGKSAAAEAAQGTVQYRSLDPAVEIDAEGKLTFKAVKADVVIEAYVVIDGNEYKISETTQSGTPYVYWLDEKTPAASAYLNATMPAEAKLQYGPGIVLYETTNCSWADDKLSFPTVGTARVRPYVTYFDVNYYGEEKVITVADDAVVYTRPTTAGKYGTICVERPSVATEGATFFLPVAIVKEGDVVTTITLEEVTEPLIAGQGYFFLANAAQLKVTMSLNDAALTQDDLKDVHPTNGMLGTFDQIAAPVDPNELFLSNNQLLYSTSEGNYIGEHRAWVKLNELQDWINANQPAPVPGRRRVSMAVEQTDTATDVLRPATYPEAAKVVLNGKVYILREGAFFTVDGRQAK